MASARLSLVHLVACWKTLAVIGKEYAIGSEANHEIHQAKLIVEDTMRRQHGDTRTDALLEKMQHG